jgi:5'-3' exonuclease
MTTKLNLKATAGQKVDIGHGEYRRQFRRAEQPFTVEDQERALLLRTGLFEDYVEKKQPKQVGDDNQNRQPAETREKE